MTALSARLRATGCTAAFTLLVFGCSNRDASSNEASSSDATATMPQTAADSQAAHIRDVVAGGGVVDSIFPIDEQLRRFRETVPTAVDTLRHASKSMAALVARLATAVETADTVAVNLLVVDRPEFAWLYYPGTKLSKPPYEAPPQLLWGQMLANSNDGAKKLFTRFAGKPFALGAPRCSETVVEGRNTLHDNCMVRITADGLTTIPIRVFGTILEREGRFKFVGLSNKL